MHLFIDLLIDMEKNYDVNNNKPLLSICIPTYNRAKYLENTLDSIVQNSVFNNRIEIVISDNASTDNTRELCENYSSKYSNIYYYRNDKNLHDENFPIVLSKGHGVYRKIANDRYIFRRNSLLDLVSIIERYKDTKPNIYFSNISSIHRIVKLKEIERLSFKEFVLKIGERAINLLHFGLWDIECENILNDITSTKLQLWQLDKIFRLVYEKRSIIIYNKLLFEFQNVENKDTTYNIYNVFHDNYLKIVSKYKNQLSKSDMYEVEKKILMDTLVAFAVLYNSKDTYLKFNESEDLNKEIYDGYHDKAYYPEYKFRLFFKKQYSKLRKIL